MSWRGNWLYDLRSVLLNRYPVLLQQRAFHLPPSTHHIVKLLLGLISFLTHIFYPTRFIVKSSNIYDIFDVVILSCVYNFLFIKNPTPVSIIYRENLKLWKLSEFFIYILHIIYSSIMLGVREKMRSELLTLLP